MVCNDGNQLEKKCLFHMNLFMAQVENEDNVLVCIRILLDLHKHYRPQMNEEVSDSPVQYD